MDTVSLDRVVDLLERVLDGAVVVDPDGRITYANPDTQRIFARDRADLVGASLAGLLDSLPDDWRTRSTVTTEARRPDGSSIPVRVSVTPFGSSTAATLQDRAVSGPAPEMPQPADDPDAMLWAIAAAVDAFLFAGEMSDSGWYLPIFHGPGIDKLIGGEVPYADANRTFDLCVHPEDYPAYEALYDLAHRVEGEPAEATYRLRGIDGRTRWVRERSVPRRLGGRLVLLGVVFDVTAEVETQAALERAQADRLAAVERFERVVELANDLILALDEDQRVCFANPAAERLLGGGPGELDGTSWEQFVHPDELSGTLEAAHRAFGSSGTEPRVVRCIGRDGNVVHVSWAGAFDAEERLMVYVGRDVTAEIRAREELERRSRTDALTGLYNRRHVVDALMAELERARRDGRLPGVVLIDLDQFKAVNDVYGHAAGDAVLRAVAHRLQAGVRRYDVVGRWGGEEFCVVVPGVGSDRALRRVAEAVRKAISDLPIPLPDGRLLRVTASAGCALATDGLWSVEAIVDAADRALYAAKRAGRNRTRLVTELTAEEIAAEEPEAIRLAQALALSAGAREGLPEHHVRQVADLSRSIAEALGLTEDAVLRCRLGGWLHDIGKVAIPDTVLTKPGPLDEDEQAVMRTHAEVGEQIVARIAGLAQAAPIVRHHHERWDGSGYPEGLAGEQIPLEARVVAVADAYSALTSDRVYRSACSVADALAELRASAGSHYDPRCVEALAEVVTGLDRVVGPVS
jgi:diguanylate cyclase (GGDEF)-like protein/PAS domain S-box-containing protein/putative nucleotidyltransferase with HDIG domain